MTKMDSLEAFRNEYRLMLDKAAKWLLFIILGLGVLQVTFSKVWYIQGFFSDAPLMILLITASIFLGNVIAFSIIDKRVKRFEEVREVIR